MIRNTDPHFVGLDTLKARHAEQIADFEMWAANGQWAKFHNSHYDWWAFPIDKPSSYGLAYTVYEGDVAALKQDAGFMAHFDQGLDLLARSWGWDLANARPLTSTARGQEWQNWPVRLYKAALSAQLFGRDAAFQSLKTYALDLMRQGEVFAFGRHDLSYLFK